MFARSTRYKGRLIGAGVLLAAVCGCSSTNSVSTPSDGGSLSNGGSPAGGAANGGAPTTGGSASNAGGAATGGAAITGGAASTGGAHASSGAGAVGGSQTTGGAIATGGVSTVSSMATGGKAAAGGASTGGSNATGGKAAGGAATGGSAATGGNAAGGAATGGKAAGGAATGGSATGGAAAGSTGGASSGACQKGQVTPSEVVFMGESFYAIAPQYNETRVESDAQAAGSLAAGAKYRNVAVSGQTMNYIATTEWTAATQGGTVKVVIMDGGGIDCMSSSCSTCPGDFTTLLGKMATAGVQDVIYTRYPEPGNPPGSNTTLKGNLDILMPKMQTVCEGTTSPRCHWVDLRPVWVNGDTSDGLHPTQSGGDHVGDAIWAEMVKDCIAQ